MCVCVCVEGGDLLAEEATLSSETTPKEGGGVENGRLSSFDLFSCLAEKAKKKKVEVIVLGGFPPPPRLN